MDFVGNKNKELDLKQLPKIVKNYITRKYPKVKVSVRRRDYDVIDITFKELPYNPYSERFIEWGNKTNWGRERFDLRFEKNRFNSKYNAMVEDIKKFTNQYNYDFSDIQTDYFDAGFYLFIDLDYDYEKQLRKGSLKKVSQKDLELQEFKEDANQFTKNNTKIAGFTYVDTSKGRRYYSISGFPIKKGLLEYMNNNGYKYELRKKVF